MKKNEKTEKKNEEVKQETALQPVPKDTVSINKKLLVCVVAVIVIIIAAAAVYLVSSRPSVDTRVTARYGDSVSVNYVGKLVNGTVFDTNYEDVAQNAGIIKTVFEPLEFKIGANKVIPGFETGVIGMHVGDKKTITIDPVQAYGEYDISLLITIPRVQELNRTITINRIFVISNSTFSLVFEKSPVLNDIVTEPQENMKYKITNISSGNITLQSVLSLGENISLFGTQWNSTVTGINNKNATLRQNPANGQVITTALGDNVVSVSENKVFIRANPVQGESVRTAYGSYLVKSVTEETIVLDGNHFLAGKPLVFDIEMLNITAANNS